MNCPRLIEVDLPIREISAESVREKSIRHGHISSIHQWWALRQRAAEPHGFATEGIVERRIPSTRKTFNPAYGKIKREYLMVFTLEKNHEN